MNKVFAIAGALALAVTPTASLAEERVVNGYTIEVYANLNNANLSRADLRSANLTNTSLIDALLSGADLRYTNLSGTRLRGAMLSGITATNLMRYPRSLPNAWVCENNSLIRR